MIVAVQGTKSFDDYNIFLRAMGTVMMSMDADDKTIVIYAVGPRRVNQMAREFCNVSERSMKARGLKIKCVNFPVQVVQERLDEVDYVVYLSKPKEPVSQLVDMAEEKDIEVGIYRY